MITIEKVSLQQWTKDTARFLNLSKEQAEFYYNKIQLPSFATPLSAGFDIYCPFPLHCAANTVHTFPTGLRFVTIEEDSLNTFMMVVPRSGLGTKFGFRLLNTVGIIDSDYQFADNEGHILVMFTVSNELQLELNTKVCQGIITNFYRPSNLTVNLTARKGGFGSTDVKK